MTFSDASAAWEGWEDRSYSGALVFCDWCQERGVSDYWTANWRQWMKFTGPESAPAWLSGELKRLVGCERAVALKAMKRSFPAVLKRLREKADISVSDLARKAGVTRAALYKLEAGDARPTWDLVQAIAAALGVPTDTFRDRRG